MAVTLNIDFEDTQMTVQHLPVAKMAPCTAASGPVLSTEDMVINQALHILEKRMFHRGESLTSSLAVREYLRLRLAAEPHEIFSAVFLDNQHRVIAFEPLFQGTIDSASVYPRVIVHKALEHRAASLIIAHNHPSGVSEPSEADKVLTRRIKETLVLIDVRLLDHFVVGEGEPFSFAEAGLL